MSADGVSLLSFLDAPFLVGDPEGRIVYVNPAFTRRFCPHGEQVVGEEMAARFAGGGREALLRAVAEVCDTGQTARFRMREDGRGYQGIVSPIEAPQAAGDRVGVVILLCDEPGLDARLDTVRREIQEPLDESLACLEQLIDQTGGRRNEAFRGAVERGMAAVHRARKWTNELTAALAGRPGSLTADASLDPVRVVRQAAARALSHLEGTNVGLDLLVPAQLPAARGDEDVLETALVRLLRLRAAKAEPASGLTLAARTMGSGERQAVLITIVDQPRGGAEDEGEDREPHSLREAVALLGGRVQTVHVPGAGRATAVRLPLAAG